MNPTPPIPSEPEHEVVPTPDGYDRWAEIYDDEHNPLVALDEPRVIEWLGDVRGLDIADLGCGTGRHAIRMAREGARVTAFDFSRGMVDKARHKPDWDKITFIEHDLSKPVPCADHSFDRVLSCLVLDHIADLPLTFHEFQRICRPTGAIVVSLMHPAMMLRGVQARFRDPATGHKVYPQSQPNQVSDYVMAAVGAGLKIDEMSEHAVDEALATQSERAAKYLGWPMLIMMRLLP